MKKEKDMASEKGEEEETEVMEPLSPVSRLLSSPQLRAIIMVTLGFKISCNKSSIVAGINESLAKFPRFSCKLDMDNKKKGEPVWVPVNIQVENHVIVPDLDHFNIENHDEFIEDYCSNIVNSPMDMTIPPWEFHVLNIKTSNAESVGIMRIHHSLGDGMSLMSLLLACSRKTSDPDALPTTAAPTRKHIVSISTDKGWWFVVGGFWYMIRFIYINVVEVFKFMLTLCFLRDTKNPLSSESMDRIKPRKVIHRVINFDDVKLVKNTMQMKVNDVLLGMTQAGLSRYLSKQYDEDTIEKKKILERIHIRGTVAVNLRPYTKIQDINDVMTKGAKCEWGNFVGLVLFPLWIRSEDDPLEYVRQAKATMDRKKLSLEALNSYGATKFTMKLFGQKVVQAISKRLYDHTTLTYSNVVGPVEEISIFDHPITYVATTATTGSQVLNIHFVSYVDKLIISVGVDPSVIPDPHGLCDDLVESLNIIKSAALERRVS